MSEPELAERAVFVKEHLADAHQDTVEYALAVEIVDDLLGREWIKMVFGPKDQADPFIGHFLDQGVPGVIHISRLKELAETLFNLQRVPGFFPDRLVSLRHDTRGVEAANLELLAGRLLMRAGVAFEYARGTTRGTSYEIDFHVGGATYPLEAKLKGEDTVCSAQTVWASLDKARKQLPKGRPGIVFLEIPEIWTVLSTNEGLIHAGIVKCLRQTDRIAAVVVIWREWQVSASGGVMIVRFLTVRNRRVPLPNDVEALLANMPSDPNTRWTTLQAAAWAALRT